MRQKNNPTWDEIDHLLKELVQFHQSQLLKCAQRLIPHITPEDLLQPNDFQELEYNPYFRYEEGLLSGVQTVQMALWALKKKQS
jgi:hypothetical protein